ncbi:DivIVA domain-containing protein [Micromonospora echinofusca]|uniref:DivIVA domain-containing protein n=1 Tax=Micromonospora echinofusca TaxID=47858 RepID=A0ABS3VUR0_MICEH|nr:DivIVA domain-containing protein [Micromonospora echinofusca]
MLRRNRSTATGRPTGVDRPAPDRRPPGRHRSDNRPTNRSDTRSAGRAGPPGRHNAGHHYRSTAYRPLCASQVRQQRFGQRRYGLDPAEVDGFLHRIADELTALHAELTRTREENTRIKGALRDWQSRFGPRVVRR